MATSPRNYFPMIISSGTSLSYDFPDDYYQNDDNLNFDDRIIVPQNAAIIFEAFKHPGGPLKRMVVVQITHIVMRYRMYINQKTDGKARDKLKNSLISLITTCDKINNLVEQTDILRSAAILDQRKRMGMKSGTFDQIPIDLSQLKPMLDFITSSARELEKDDEALRHFSASPQAGGNRKAERLLIWEPIFELWKSAGLQLRLSGKGPLMRALEAVHNSCGLETPSLHAVREVVRASEAMRS